MVSAATMLANNYYSHDSIIVKCECFIIDVPDSLGIF